jgi:hypothetical protein
MDGGEEMKPKGLACTGEGCGRCCWAGDGKESTPELEGGGGKPLLDDCGRG